MAWRDTFLENWSSVSIRAGGCQEYNLVHPVLACRLDSDLAQLLSQHQLHNLQYSTLQSDKLTFQPGPAFPRIKGGHNTPDDDHAGEYGGTIASSLGGEEYTLSVRESAKKMGVGSHLPPPWPWCCISAQVRAAAIYWSPWSHWCGLVQGV